VLVYVSVSDVGLIVLGKVMGGCCCCPLFAEYSSDCVIPVDIELFVDGLADDWL